MAPPSASPAAGLICPCSLSPRAPCRCSPSATLSTSARAHKRPSSLLLLAPTTTEAQPPFRRRRAPIVPDLDLQVSPAPCLSPSFLSFFL